MHNSISGTSILGKPLLYLTSCHSTNDYLRSQMDQLREGALVICEHQTLGKGQRGNRWEAEPGKNLTCSVLLRPDFLDIYASFQLNIISALSVAEVVTHFASGREVKVKWPNDVYVEDRKIAGILTENGIQGNQFRFSILGIGLNINQMQFEHPKAVSLQQLTGQPYAVMDIAERLMQQLETNYLQLKTMGASALEETYIRQLYWKDEWHHFASRHQGFKGKILGINSQGQLRVETEELGVREFTFKEIEYLY